MKLKSQSKPATDARIGNMQHVHRTAVSNIFDGCDDPLSAQPTSVPVIQVLRNNPLSSSVAPKTKSIVNTSAQQGESKFAVLKCLKGCKDPVIAASKVRKATLRDVGVFETKASKAIDVCKEALDLINDDFDCEDIPRGAEGRSTCESCNASIENLRRVELSVEQSVFYPHDSH